MKIAPELQFFPSRTLGWYMARNFLVKTLAVLAALVFVLQTLDLLGESGDILAYPGNGQHQIWHYVALRVPQLIAFLLPFSVLLGTLITLVTLNQNSEVIAMKAGGVSAHQILAPLVLASLGIAGLSFMFNERLVTRATATLDAWQDVNYGPIPKGRASPSNIWVRDGDDIVHANQVSGKGTAMAGSDMVSSGCIPMDPKLTDWTGRLSFDIPWRWQCGTGTGAVAVGDHVCATDAAGTTTMTKNGASYSAKI